MNLRPVLRPQAVLVLVQVAAQVQALVAVLALALVAAQAQVLVVAPALLRPPLLQVQAAAQAVQAAPVPAHLLLVAVQAARVAHAQVHLPQAAVAPAPHPHLPLVHLQAPRHQVHLQVQVALVHLQAQAALRHHPLQALPPVLHPQAHLLQAPHRRAQAVLLHLHQAHRQAVQAQAGILIFNVTDSQDFFALNQSIQNNG